MNIFLMIILVALIFEYALNMVANFLNLKSLRSEAPSELSGVYDPIDYRRSQDYTRITTRFGLIAGTFKLGILLTFWFTGGFNWIDGILRDQGFPAIIDGLLFIGVLLLGHLVLMLPFGIYSTFVIEEKFGFNKTTLNTFVADQVKGLALLVVIGGPLLVGILGFFEHAGSLAWLYCWAVATLFTIGLQFVAPIWIMPLFNKFTSMESSELKDSILKYIRSVDFTVDNILLMDGSKRSDKSNAFFTGFGRHKRIVLFDTLVEKHTNSELVAVLAHEIGHYKQGHIIQSLVISILHAGFVFFLLSIFLDSPGLYDAFFMDQQSIYAGLLFFSLLYTPVELFLGTVIQGLSRKHEFDADRWAVETVDEPQSLATGLKRLSADNLSNLDPHPMYVFLNYSHPPLLQRLRAIDQVRS